jgi:hypothetical protein
MTRQTILATLAAGGMWLGQLALAQEPRSNPPAPAAERGDVRAEPGARPMPRRGDPDDPPARGEFGKGPKGQPPRGGDFRPGPEGRGPDGRGPEGRPGSPAGEPPLRGEGRRPGMGPREGRPPAGTLMFPGMFGGPGQDLRRMQQEDPDMYELLVADDDLDRQALEKAEQLRRATTENREKLKTELAEIVGKHFEARQKRRELQLKRMEEEIQRLRDAIKTRNDAREDIVNKRITELTGDVNPLDF